MANDFNCENCKFEVMESDYFCPNCGSIFIDNKCANHTENSAEGVCLICQKICCSECGLDVNGAYLCNDHSNIEIIQSMGRVYGTSDSLEIDYILSVLEDENFHPFRYSRKASPISLGGSDYTLFRSSGESNGNIINEIKIMIPLNEYLEAKKLIENINKN